MLHALPYILLGIGVLVYVSYRQTLFSAVTRRKSLRLPLILLIAALIAASQMFTAQDFARFSPVDGALIVGEVALAVVAGWAMGKLTQIATVDSVLSSRLLPAGLAIWFAFLALRILGSVFAQMHHLTLTGSVPSVLLMIAVVKGIQALMVQARIAAMDTAPAVG